MPILILTRAKEVGRKPVASDFTCEERSHLRRVLRECILAADSCGDQSHGNRLRDDWTRCVALDEPPRFPVIPQLEEIRKGFELARDLTALGASGIELGAENAATDT